VVCQVTVVEKGPTVDAATLATANGGGGGATVDVETADVGVETGREACSLNSTTPTTEIASSVSPATNSARGLRPFRTGQA
jgi:hypothetical protein